MAKKKTHLVEYAAIYAFLFIILLAIVLLLAVIKFNKFDPDKHVCEEWDSEDEHCTPMTKNGYYKYIKDGYDCITDTKQCGRGNAYCSKCLEYRSKTICELDPNAEGCICDEWGDTDNRIRGFACPNSCRTIKIRRCKINGIYSYNKELDIRGTIFYDICDLGIIHDKRITSVKNLSMEIYEENITNCRQCYEYEKTCIKSHLPPTPIKINLGEERCVEWSDEIEVVNMPISTCEYIRIWCEEDYSCEELDWVNGLSCCGYYDKYCCLKKEQKNECEKGNDGWVWDWNYRENKTPAKYLDTDGNISSYRCEDIGYAFDTINKVCIPYVEPEKFCRKKTFCDKYPGAKGCICDEYNFEEGRYPVNLSWREKEIGFLIENGCQVKTNYFIYEIENRNLYLDSDSLDCKKRICIKAHGGK